MQAHLDANNPTRLILSEKTHLAVTTYPLLRIGRPNTSSNGGANGRGTSSTQLSMGLVCQIFWCNVNCILDRRKAQNTQTHTISLSLSLSLSRLYGLHLQRVGLLPPTPSLPRRQRCVLRDALFGADLRDHHRHGRNK